MNAISPLEAPSRRPSLILSLIGWGVALLLLGIVFAVWSVVSVLPGMRLFLTPPMEVFGAFGSLWDHQQMLSAAIAALRAWLIGFAPAAILALGLGILAGRFRAASAVMGPSLMVFGALPVIGLSVLFIIWFGLAGDERPAVTAGLLAFFPMVAISAYAQGSSEAARRRAGLCRALEIGAVLALVGVMFAHTLAGDRNFGGMLLLASTGLDTRLLLELIVVLWLLGVLLALPFALLRWVVGFVR
jgi:ABC-type nitrate/sulfonate/bicarbonate transport system permease component